MFRPGPAMSGCRHRTKSVPERVATRWYGLGRASSTRGPRVQGDLSPPVLRDVCEPPARRWLFGGTLRDSRSSNARRYPRRRREPRVPSGRRIHQRRCDPDPGAASARVRARPAIGQCHRLRRRLDRDDTLYDRVGPRHLRRHHTVQCPPTDRLHRRLNNSSAVRARGGVCPRTSPTVPFLSDRAVPGVRRPASDAPASSRSCPRWGLCGASGRGGDASAAGRMVSSHH